MVAAVDVDHLTSDGCAAVTGEEHASLAEFLSGNVAFERRVGRVVLHQVGESGDAASGQGVHRAGTDAVHANFLFTKVGRQITRARLKRRLGHAHDVVVRNNFLRAVVAHADDAATVGHQRLRPPGQSHQRIGADI
ncbi:uncharacterized protein METZ01_LOCUS361515, partial [marine metagenome]